MSLQFTYTRVYALILTCLLGWVIFIVPVQAQTVIERLVSPGSLSEQHQEFEKDCKACHVKFDKTKQTSLCLDCHKKVASDVKLSTGFHGKSPDVAGKPCKSCHTEHEGLKFDIVKFDRNNFNHTLTDYPLLGAHKPVQCAQCHNRTKKYREAPKECVSCHRADEPHKGNLGTDCQSCHNVSDWKQVKFDHTATKFALLGKHSQVKCSACHIGEIYKGLPANCIDCHKKDDTHKGTFGVDCASCHTNYTWVKTTFKHKQRTGFALTGKHKKTQCGACHTETLVKPKLNQACISCHRKDDTHNGRNGATCADCHITSSWRSTNFNHDTETKFALLGAHKNASCESCHLQSVTEKLPGMLCVDCHRADDKHNGRNGPNCKDCHNNTDWQTVNFDHNLDTKFVLQGAHIQTPCENCHLEPVTQSLPGTACADCHRADDPHEGSLGRDCSSCHNELSWTQKTKFNHEFTRFPLLGKHQNAECSACHLTKNFQQAHTDCISCHKNDDTHQGALGVDCGLCHNPNSWSLWIFDHNIQTQFALTGAHDGLSCKSCHINTDTKLPEQTCIACHRSDDKHRGQFGKNCARCHTTDSFKSIKFP